MTTEYSVDLTIRTDMSAADVVRLASDAARLLDLESEVKIMAVNVARWDDDEGEYKEVVLVGGGDEESA